MRPEKEITIRKKDEVLFGWFFLAAGILGMAVTGIMLYGLFFDNPDGERTGDYLTVLMPLSVACLVINQMALWRINGRDVIAVYPNHLTIQSRGALIHAPPMVFRFDRQVRVEALERDYLRMEKNRMVMKGYDGVRKFGQGLSEKDLSEMLKMLNDLIEAKRTPAPS